MDRRRLFVPALALFLTGCGAGAAPEASTPPTIVVLEPSGEVEVALGAPAPIEIRYRDDDPDSEAKTDLLADVDGIMSTTDDQVRIVDNVPEANGAVQSYMWDPTGVPAATYKILAVTTDTRSLVVAQSSGAVTLNGAPTINIIQPAGTFLTSRGGSPWVEYIDDDSDDSALTWFQLDRDGDLSTTADTYIVSPFRPEGGGATQRIQLNLDGVPPDRYTLFGTVWDGMNPAVSMAAPADFYVYNMGFARAASADVRLIDVAHRPDGSTIVIGSFRGACVFGAGDPNETTLDTGSFADQNTFIARYLWTGKLSWVRRIGVATQTVTPSGVAVLPDGACLVTGGTADPSTFGVGEAGEVTLTPAGNSDFFLARIEANGDLGWARLDGGADDVRSVCIAAYPDGSCVVGLRCVGESVTLGSGDPNETRITIVETLTGIDADVAVGRYAADGSLMWGRAAVGPSRDEVSGIAALEDGSCVVVGRYRESLTFGKGEANEKTLTSVGAFDVFLAKLEPNGDLAYVKAPGGDGNDEARAVAGFSDSSFVVVGTYDVSVTFAAATATPITRTTSGGGDANIFAAKYAGDGSLLAVRVAGSLGNDEVGDVVAHADGSFSIAGRFADTWGVLGAGEARQTYLSAVDGVGPAFLAKFFPDGNLLRATRLHERTGFPQAIATRPGGSVEIIGYFFNTATFGRGDGVGPVIESPEGSFVGYYLAYVNADGGF